MRDLKPVRVSVRRRDVLPTNLVKQLQLSFIRLGLGSTRVLGGCAVSPTPSCRPSCVTGPDGYCYQSCK